MLARVTVLVALTGACGGPDPVTPNDADGSDGSVVPCTHPSLDRAVATIAGCEQEGVTDGPRDEVRFRDPTNVVVVGDALIVADFENDRLRRIAPDGTTTTLVKRDDFHNPFGLAVAGDGMIYAETDDNDQGVHTIDSGTVWRVDPTTGSAAVVARDLGRPRGLAVLPDGRIAMSDHMHHVLKILDPATGLTTPLAGTADVAGFTNATGLAARFAQPYDIVLLPDGDLAVADQDNHRIRRVTLAGVVTDLAGSGTLGNIDGPTAVAEFHAPQGLAVAPDGALYVTDIKRHFVRRIANDLVTTVAGDGTAGWLDSNEPRSARFYGLEGMDASATQLVVTDGNIGDGMAFHRIRTIRLDALP
jgi:sugar lactone lactonase YvrE